MRSYPCFVENGIIKTTAAGFEAIQRELNKNKCELMRPGDVKNARVIAWGCEVRVVPDEEIAGLIEQCRD